MPHKTYQLHNYSVLIHFYFYKSNYTNDYVKNHDAFKASILTLIVDTIISTMNYDEFYRNLFCKAFRQCFKLVIITDNIRLMIKLCGCNQQTLLPAIIKLAVLLITHKHVEMVVDKKSFIH